jgi:hypothetical protein
LQRSRFRGGRLGGGLRCEHDVGVAPAACAPHRGAGRLQRSRLRGGWLDEGTVLMNTMSMSRRRLVRRITGLDDCSAAASAAGGLMKGLC